ncbi:type II secretion system F family protein [Actimicrobium sp. CCI2.3]|uniref:type II secretion system F family protein n=1 Tax=Actimicrobium sp. CCI2.3 TaxID=3048616 RepID=UPI002AB4855A|nr:type II secretion system F family protein [Actimicrobium sp. CCI2.3]MDY7572989.1 type II secretion system F family protein [Actimicrobium sp. CCI2.3]MEB0023633.1 type II secretion system F family protein [Actimicrobium sp. CCI2.3]
METLKNFSVTYLLPFADDADAVRDRSARKHFRHNRIMVATSREQIVHDVRKTGGVPIDIRIIKPAMNWLNPVSRDYKQQFLLAIYFNTQAGLSAGRALKLVIDAENGPQRQRLNFANLILDGGGSFLDAMEALGFFDQTTLAILEAGEKTGTLSSAINTAIDYYQARAGTLKILMGTAIFTAIEVAFSVLSLIGNRVAVLPAIEKEISENTAPEKIASIKRGIAVAYFANDLMLLVSLGLVVFAAVCTWGYLNGSSDFRKKVDDIILCIPQVKDIVLHGALANSTKVAVSLIRGGVDLIVSFAIAEKASRVPRVLGYWRGAVRRIEDGEDIAHALAQTPLENSERTLIRSHTDRHQLARAFEVIAERREVFAQRAAKKFQVFSFIATLAFSLVAVLIALFVALIQSEGSLASMTSL